MPEPPQEARGKEALAIDDDTVASFEELQVAPAADREIETIEDRKRLHDVLDAPPGALRVPLIMCDMDELSYDEIAAALGIGLSAVKMRIKRAIDLGGKVGVDSRLAAVGSAPHQRFQQVFPTPLSIS